METHREGQAQGDRATEGGLRAGAAWGTEVFLLLRGRGAVEDKQDRGPGPLLRGTQGRRHKWGPRDRPAGAVCSSVGTRSSPRQPWVLAGLMSTGDPKARCRKKRAGTSQGTGPAGAPLGRWGPRASLERGCRATGREGPPEPADLRRLGASPGGLGEMGEAGGEEGHPQAAPGRPWASSSHPGASPREPGADGTASSWRRSPPETCPRAPRPPGTSQPWPGRHKLQWQQGSAGIEAT